MVYEPEKHKKPGAIAKFILKSFVKSKVVGEKAYPQNGPTAPQFIISDHKNFEEEKKDSSVLSRKHSNWELLLLTGKNLFLSES
jgi:hypothetical protein